MCLRDLSDLKPEARIAAEHYLASVRAVLRPEGPEIENETLESLTSHLLGGLDAESGREDVVRLVEELGPAELFAEALRDESGDPRVESQRGAGHVLGMPYDVRLPTSERVASRWWNPREPKLFVPRVFGVGWDLNFGALAVRLHLIEPDAEDEPFAEVSDRAFLLALLVPVGLTAFILGSFLALRGALPSQLPVHWDWRGIPDRYSSQMAAFGFVFALAAAPTAWAVWSVATHRPALNRGAVIGLASMMSALASSIWLLTLASGLGAATSGIWFFLAIVVALLVPLAVMTGLARSGSAVERRRDLSREH